MLTAWSARGHQCRLRAAGAGRSLLPTNGCPPFPRPVVAATSGTGPPFGIGPRNLGLEPGEESSRQRTGRWVRQSRPGGEALGGREGRGGEGNGDGHH